MSDAKDNQDRPVRILMIDDDPTAIAFMQVIAKRFQIELLATDQPEKFLSLIDLENPDACLVDLDIYEAGSGFELIRSARRSHPSLPLCVLSGRSDGQSISHALEMGASDFLVKPVDPEIFASKMRRFVSNSAMKDAQLTYFPAQGDCSMLIELEFKLTAIDEFGITLIGPHLLTKGIQVSIESPVLTDILDDLQREFSISFNWANEDGTTFGAFAEFDLRGQNGKEIHRKVLHWLKK